MRLRSIASSRQPSIRPLIVRSTFAIATLLAGVPALAQDNYPSRPIRLVVPSAAGSAQDIVVRLLQPHLEKSFKQPIVIENRSGASTTLGADAVARATPDGYTLLVEPTTFTVNAALTKKLPYDIERDFEPVALLVKNPLLLAINSKLPARSLIEFLDLAKASRGKFNYATPGAASQAHLLIEMLSARANIKMQHVPYRGGGPAALSVAAGETELTLLSPVVLQSHMQSGAVRALATGGMTRDSQFPDLPTIAESGFSDFQAVQWLGLLTTGRTPKAIVQKLNREVNRILANPQIASRLASQGTTPAGGSPDEFRQLIAAELKNWKDVAQRANIKAK